MTPRGACQPLRAEGHHSGPDSRPREGFHHTEQIDTVSFGLLQQIYPTRLFWHLVAKVAGGGASSVYESRRSPPPPE